MMAPRCFWSIEETANGIKTNIILVGVVAAFAVVKTVGWAAVLALGPKFKARRENLFHQHLQAATQCSRVVSLLPKASRKVAPASCSSFGRNLSDGSASDLPEADFTGVRANLDQLPYGSTAKMMRGGRLPSARLAGAPALCRWLGSCWIHHTTNRRERRQSLFIGMRSPGCKSRGR